VLSFLVSKILVSTPGTELPWLGANWLTLPAAAPSRGRSPSLMRVGRNWESPIEWAFQQCLNSN